MDSLLPALVTTILVAVPLTAQDGKPWQFGTGLSYSGSTGGFAALVFGEKPLTDHLAIRMSVNHGFGETTGAYDAFVHDVRQRGMDITWIWSLNKLGTSGPIAFASLGFRNTTWYETINSPYGTSEITSRNTSVLPTYKVGVGYTITTNIKFFECFNVVVLHDFSPDPILKELKAQRRAQHRR